jgi:hypothetical protein
MSNFPDAAACVRANLAARFHPARPGDGSLPAVEVAGALVFAYLDPDTKQLCVTVDLDGLNEASELVDETGNVPVQINVGIHKVFAA